MTRNVDCKSFGEILSQSPDTAKYTILAHVYAKPYLDVAVMQIPAQEVLVHLAVRGPLLGLN